MSGRNEEETTNQNNEEISVTTTKESQQRQNNNEKHNINKQISWEKYWHKYEDYKIEERHLQGKFRVYFSGHQGPVLLCIHGAGYTSLTWSLLASSNIKEKCQVMAVDLRGHGHTETEDESNLSVNMLSNDIVSVWKEICKSNFASSEEPALIIIGHSMGGALAVHSAKLNEFKTLQGVIVVDVVEGTALASLPYMMSILNKRPQSFKTLEEAINWSISEKVSKNRKAACVSVPSMLIQDNDDKWIWRTNLKDSSIYWKEWYDGLSNKFLSLSAAKLLVLVGTDRMDKTLTIGQMQGKFQMAVLPASGHAVQEDESERMAEIIIAFINKFRIGQELPDFLKKNKK